MSKSQLQPSEAALDLLKQFEGGPKGGFAARPYICPAGKRTVGWGHVVRASDHFEYPLTSQEAENILRGDLAKFANGVNLVVRVPITQSMFDALCCLAFNIGLTNFQNSTLLKKLNQQDYSGAADEFGKWNKARDPKTDKLIPLPGLTRRRAAERELFLRDAINPNC